MKRRSLLKYIAGLPVLGAAGYGILKNKPSSMNQKQGDNYNILMITVDDLNDWIGPLGGYQGIHTPNIDKLAARSINFQNTYCQAPLCNASRTSCLSGIYPHSSGMYTNWGDYFAKEERIISLPRFFKERGYKTHGLGKVFHNNDINAWHSYTSRVRDNIPEEMNNSLYNSNEVMSPFGCNLPDELKEEVNPEIFRRKLDWGPVSVDDSQMDDARLVEAANKFLSQHHSQPFFLSLGLYRPHLPWHVPKKYFDLYPIEKIKVPVVKPDDWNDIPEIARKIAYVCEDHGQITKNEQWKYAVQAYLACISFADAMVGKALDALSKSSYADNTIIVFWSDHGWHLGEKLRWRKFSLWEEATRTPMMLSLPGDKHTQGNCTANVGLIDLYPTLVELCGVSGFNQLQGRSLVPLLHNTNLEWPHPALTTWLEGNHSIRHDHWRYTRYRDGSEELYDHRTDQHEWNNLASDHRYSETITKLTTVLNEAIKTT